MTMITITAGSVALEAELTDTPTTQAILEALPIEGKANTWGDEIYFTIPVCARLEPEARADMEVGEIAYWPPGAAFCIFFGRTPASTDDRPRAYSPVNILGAVSGEVSALRTVSSGTTIRLTRAGGDAG